MVDACWLVCVVCCLLYVVRRLAFVACCRMIEVGCCVLCVECILLLCVVSCLLLIGRC